jgi:cytochrome c peroxidase
MRHQPFAVLFFKGHRWLQRLSLFAALVLVMHGSAQADIGPIPISLKGVAVPTPVGLFDGPQPVLVDRQKAIALGKALFWDINVGSDGMACASCHFHAGADRRTTNQLAASNRAGASGFDVGTEGQRRGPNQALRLADFPLTESQSPLTETDIAGFARYTDDVVGSAGSFGGTFKAVEYSDVAGDTCVRTADAVHQVAGVGTRRVIARNAPTVINAVFNHRLMWDGRANHVFNGVNGHGPRDASAGVWALQADGSVRKEALALDHSALASQAVMTALNDREMSCKGRTLADLGRKLLYRTALEQQMVDLTDSVLGALARARAQPSGPGLTVTYLSLVQQAFHPRWWRYLKRDAFGRPNTGVKGTMSQAYSQAEANFGLFFGVALQMYQSTLVSDDSPFDRSARDSNNLPRDLNAAQQRGLQVFRRAHCNQCHTGPTFSTAAIDVNASLVPAYPWAFGGAGFRNVTSSNVVTRMAGQKGFGLIDTGFAATGVGQDAWDSGLAGKDDLGMDIALAAQYLQLLTGQAGAVKDLRVASVRPCDLASPLALNQAAAHRHYFTRAQGLILQPQATTGCLNAHGAYMPTAAAAMAELQSAQNTRMLLMTDSAFKIPTLRNVELTGPYMHNGSMATLEQVVAFYARGGNFTGVAKQFGTIFPQPELQEDAQARSDLIAFLQSLTDERVRHERAPFDHPELPVPHGHVGSRLQVSAGNPLEPALAQDSWLFVPAVGAAGRATPLLPFSAYLAP